VQPETRVTLDRQDQLVHPQAQPDRQDPPDQQVLDRPDPRAQSDLLDLRAQQGLRAQQARAARV